ncbi:glycosyl hydrolase family 18 protein [Pelotomaculum propionicicum]
MLYFYKITAFPSTNQGLITKYMGPGDRWRSSTAFSKVPTEKISLGIASYGYDWLSGGTRANVVTTLDVMQKTGHGGFTAGWDEPSRTPFVKYRDSQGRDREIWFENSAGAGHKMALVKRYRLAGFYFWRLGYEDAKFWQTVRESLLQ